MHSTLTQSGESYMFKLKPTLLSPRWTAVAFLAVAALAFGTPSARADVITFNLDTPNTAISGFTGPYGTVTVDRTSTTTATITLTSLTNSGNIYLFGDGSTIAL